ncbi:hypothetical protein, partial [Ferrovum sp.]|uniref:hypothetical protein n=1 Tax=Ferrovum sp. TaxID=2609467 RepID=UPI002630ED37
MPPQIQQGDLTYLAADALRAHKPVGKVGFPGGFVVGFGLANKHSMMLPEKQGVLLSQAKCYGTTQGFCRNQKVLIHYNQNVTEIYSEKLTTFPSISLKVG